MLAISYLQADHSAWVHEVALARSKFRSPDRVDCCVLTDARSMSYMEMRLVLARLLWCFDVKNADDMHEWDPTNDFHNIKAYSTWQKPGLNVRLIPVKR